MQVGWEESNEPKQTNPEKKTKKERSQIDRTQANTQADKRGGDREGMSDGQDQADGGMVRWRRERSQLERQTGGG